MTTHFCPTSRTFYKFRNVLTRELDLGRHEVRPAAVLEDLIPPSERQRVWQALRCEGLSLPSLTLSSLLWFGSAIQVVLLAAWVSFWCHSWFGLLTLLPFGWLAYLLSRPWAVHIDRCGPLTLRDAVYYLTDFREAIHAGYRMSRKEIEIKVRLIVAKNLGITMDKVTPESRFVEDLGAG